MCIRDRYTDWRLEWVDLSSLDLNSPRGSEHGLLVVDPFTRAVLGGWDHIHQAQSRGASRLAAYVGVNPSRRWLPQSHQEQVNREAFLAVQALREAFGKSYEGKRAVVQWKTGSLSLSNESYLPQAEALRKTIEASTGVDPNAVGASGRTLLASLLESSWFGGPEVVAAATLVLKRGGLLLRSSQTFLPTPGAVRTPLDVAMDLLGSAIRQDEHQQMLEPLSRGLVASAMSWGEDPGVSALEALFADLSPEQTLPVSLDHLRTLWRSAVLNQHLPQPAVAKGRARF